MYLHKIIQTAKINPQYKTIYEKKSFKAPISFFSYFSKHH